MTEGVDVFKAKISATDDASQVLAFIKNHAKQLGLEFREVGHKMHDLEHKSMWSHLRDHTQEAGKNFSELGEHVNKVHEGLSELVPAFGAISAVGVLGSAGALVENVEHMAEAYGELNHQAKALGISATELYRWNAVAKMTDTNAESMQHSLARLNRTLSEAAHGRNKEAAALFAHMHMDPKTFTSSADALPRLAEAFQRTIAPADRARMAQVLFGRAGMDMIPMLEMGPERLKEFADEAGKLAPSLSALGPGLEKYNESMKKMGIATDAFRYTVAGELAPALTPIVDQMTEWSAANREWIATGLKDEITDIGGELRQIDWRGIGHDLKYIGNIVGDFIEDIGGARTAVDLLAGAMAFKGVTFLAREVKAIALTAVEIGGLAAKIAGLEVGWKRVAVAAETAAAAEEGAAAAGGAASAAGGTAAAARGLFKPGLTVAGLAGWTAAPVVTAIGTAIALKTSVEGFNHATGLDAYSDAHAGANMRGGHRTDNGPRHVYGFGAGQAAAAAAAAAAPPAKAEVTLEIKGLPAGTSVSSSGLAAPPVITRGGYTTDEH